MIATAGTCGGEHVIGGANDALLGGILEDGDRVVVPFVSFVVIDAAAGHTGARIDAEHPIVDVDLVGSEVGHGAAGIFFKPTPIAKLVHVGVAVFGELGVREAFADGEAEVGGDGTVPFAGDVRDPAEEAIAGDDFILRVLVARIAAALVAQLEKLLGFAGGNHHGAGAFHGVGHEFLAVNVLAGLVCGDGVFGVLEVGRRDNHGVEILHGGEQLAVVLERLRIVTELLQDVLCVVAVDGPDIANGFEADTGDFQRSIDQNAALFTAADDGHVNLIGSRAVGTAGDVGSGGDKGSELGARAEEIAPGDVVVE